MVVYVSSNKLRIETVPKYLVNIVIRCHITRFLLLKQALSRETPEIFHGIPAWNALIYTTQYTRQPQPVNELSNTIEQNLNYQGKAIAAWTLEYIIFQLPNFSFTKSKKCSNCMQWRYHEVIEL